MRIFGLIGYPLSHSFSKRYFEKKFEKEGLDDCRFENFSIPTINDLINQVIPGNPGLEGVAVTIPYKQAVLPFLHSVDGIPEGLRACNCIKIKEGKLTGFNTDYIGFQESFKTGLRPHHKQALILGNGGATASVIFVLQRMGIGYKIVSRQLHNGSDYVYEEITGDIIKQYPLIINTTPLGMYPNTDTCPPLPYNAISSQHYLYDLVYNPELTLFLQNGKEKGATVKNGADMLEIQAEENWKIWNS